MRVTKKSKVLSELKRQVFAAPGGISRREASERLGIDLRTAGAYLEELFASGVVRREVRESVSRGRPGNAYCLNTNNLAFLGLTIRQDSTVTAKLIDSHGNLLAGQRFAIPDSPSHMTFFNSVLDIARKYTELEQYRLGGIGLAISRWHQPPLAGSDLYGAFEGFLARALNVPVHRDLNINALAYACSITSGKRNLAIIHAGNVMEFGLVQDGEPAMDFSRREKWLSHLCVNPKGRQCYCGKFGCLVNYVSAAALRERLVINNSPLNVKVLGEILGLALVHVAKHYPKLEALLFFGAEPLQKTANEYFAKHAPRPELLTIGEKILPESVAFGVAQEAAHFELYQYLPVEPEAPGKPFYPIN